MTTLAALQFVLPVLLAGGWTVHAVRLYRRLYRIRRDPLTGLLTRDGWIRAAERIIRRNRRAVIVLGDLNGFKPVNDKYGHDVGDVVLATVGERLTAWCGTHAVAGRLGGDELVAVLRDDQDLQQRLAELAQLVRQPVVDKDRGLSLQVGISLGSARLADLETPTLAAALKAADTAMYRAKGRGRRGRGHLPPALAALGRRLTPRRFRLAA
ncbi:GGDEF domain-containing protein [Streptomyces ipomoeae]|uniref:GGDEF domain-containing protein n=1 Tax=Streptomyces ipomoeae TaxID=103232 RepID=UPI0029BAA0B6|nr:GGDEF domain-containing protein [Streptomyces ipomoeae]MDX2698930.1 GGDEF domain-containing protein [Streptomyces ipomoeae]MDX2844572.1 GGDEF domain-containing protein [Streptomyces ipomoeae]